MKSAFERACGPLRLVEEVQGAPVAEVELILLLAPARHHDRAARLQHPRHLLDAADLVAHLEGLVALEGPDDVETVVRESLERGLVAQLAVADLRSLSDPCTQR